ncbi:hypothetical protein E1B28_005567 [Marasmius oreades]|uniref:Uncharacterized protein n=1 Tax=Marasmius oreades TaxID=181124 RepID=A0A9P7S3F8_9AGAR|nr:uncharacterized protein E1B28_005567 [Marasmius oreades]KAG7094751.1 hypothetical protein E1B28_005567 [Marasmius oreades]
MGASSVNAVAEGRCLTIESVLDYDQRGQYFEHLRHHDDVLNRDANKLEAVGGGSVSRKGGPQMKSESLAQKFDTPVEK